MTMRVTAEHCLGDNLHYTAAEDGGGPRCWVTEEHLLFQAGEWWPEPGHAYPCIR